MGDLHVSFTGIIEILEDINNQETDDSYMKAIADAMHKKISEYWTNVRNACPASVLLDPNCKSAYYGEEVKHSEITKNLIIHTVCNKKKTDIFSLSLNACNFCNFFSNRML